MTDFILQNEASLRLGFFISILLIMMLVEALFPRKRRAMGRGHRWLSNILMTILDALFVRFAFPILAIGVAALSAQKGWGLFNLTDWQKEGRSSQ